MDTSIMISCCRPEDNRFHSNIDEVINMYIPDKNRNGRAWMEVRETTDNNICIFDIKIETKKGEIIKLAESHLNLDTCIINTYGVDEKDAIYEYCPLSLGPKKSASLYDGRVCEYAKTWFPKKS